MSSLPEKGEALRAIVALRDRADASNADRDWKGSAELGNILVGSGRLSGDKSATLMVYGDLVDVADLMESGVLIVKSAMLSMVEGKQDLFSGLASMLIQGVATGVLMERARWERKP